MSLGPPTYEQLAALVVEQAATIERLEVEVVELRGEVAELRRRLAQNSRNSSRPPSSDGLAKPSPKSLRRPSGRKPGGQQGHEGGHLAQVAAPDAVVDHVPAVCGGCRGALGDGVDVEHRVRQVFDLPEVRLSAVEHRAWTRRCACGHETTAQSAQASWTMTVAQNPETDQALVIDFGNGAGTTVYVPEGTGSTTVAISNVFQSAAGVWGGVSERVEWTVTAVIAAVTTVTGVVVSPSSSPATVTVHQC